MPKRPSSTEPPPATSSDELLRDKVMSTLMVSHDLTISGMRVTARSGRVILDGTVESREMASSAEARVSTIPGVTHTENRLRVIPRRAA